MTPRKLTHQQVLEIRANSTDSSRTLAKVYGVSHRLICDVRNNKVYTDVKSPGGISNRRGNRKNATKVHKVQNDEARARAVLADPKAPLGDKRKARDVLCALGMADYDDFPLPGWTAVPVSVGGTTAVGKYLGAQSTPSWMFPTIVALGVSNLAAAVLILSKVLAS